MYSLVSLFSLSPEGLHVIVYVIMYSYKLSVLSCVTYSRSVCLSDCYSTGHPLVLIFKYSSILPLPVPHWGPHNTLTSTISYFSSEFWPNTSYIILQGHLFFSHILFFLSFSWTDFCFLLISEFNLLVSYTTWALIAIRWCIKGRIVSMLSMWGSVFNHICIIAFSSFCQRTDIFLFWSSSCIFQQCSHNVHNAMLLITTNYPHKFYI